MLAAACLALTQVVRVQVSRGAPILLPSSVMVTRLVLTQLFRVQVLTRQPF